MEQFRVVDFYAPSLDQIGPKLRERTDETAESKIWSIDINQHGLPRSEDFFRVTIVLIYYNGTIK